MVSLLEHAMHSLHDSVIPHLSKLSQRHITMPKDQFTSSLLPSIRNGGTPKKFHLRRLQVLVAVNDTLADPVLNTLPSPESGGIVPVEVLIVEPPGGLYPRRLDGNLYQYYEL